MLSAASLLTVGLTIASAASQGPSGPAATPPPDRPFAGLFANLGHDISALPSRTTLVALAVGGTGAIVMRPFDDNLAGWVEQRASASYTRFGRIAGDGWSQAGVAVGVYAAGLAAGHRPTSHLGADLIRGQVLTGLITHGLKAGVDRRRPSGGKYSFPSGHTSSSFLTAAVIDGHYGWRVALPAYGLAGFVGWTRVRDDVHWLTDVIVGGTVGIIVGRTVTANHRTGNWAIGVSPVPGGGLMVAAVKAGETRRGVAPRRGTRGR